MSFNILDKIPDPEFRRYLLENCDKDGDGKISPEEALTVTKIAINWSATGYPSIGSLEGLQYFPNLKDLCCLCNHEKPILGFDISKNSKLEYLECTMMDLEQLNTSCNPLLRSITCCFNCLKELDLSNNPLLEEVDCSYNCLNELSLKENRALKELYCSGNKLTELDLSTNHAIEILDCCDNNLTKLDLNNNREIFKLDCSDNLLSELDLSMTKIGDNGDKYSLLCGLQERSEAETLKTVYLRNGQDIPNITKNRQEHNIPPQSEIIFVD